MKFLCLAYYDEKTYEGLPQGGDRSHRQTVSAARRGAARQRTFVSASPRSNASRNSVSIRPTNGKPVITDGPFTEAKEVLGSFFLIEAENMDEAVRIASLHPAAHLGETSVGASRSAHRLLRCALSA